MLAVPLKNAGFVDSFHCVLRFTVFSAKHRISFLNNL